MPRFEPIESVCESLCIRSGDPLQRNKALYLDVAGDVWIDMNEDVLKLAERVKMPVRRLFQINKRTNSIDLPCNYLRLSSVNVLCNGCWIPVFRNDSIHDDIVDLSEAPNCACAYKCGYKLCNTIKGYEVINHTETDKNPAGDTLTFNCVDKKVIMGGWLYEQLQYPQRIYTNGTWTSTVLHTENKKLCEVEVDKNGCCCDTPANIDNVCNACGIGNNDNSQCCIGGTASTPPAADCNQWLYYCPSKMDWLNVQCGGFSYFRKGCNNIYNISELGDRLIFPHNFGFSQVLIRMYVDITLEDLQIPYLAKQTFMTGMQYFASINNPKKFQEGAMFGNLYAQQKWGLFLTLNKYRFSELREIMTPPVFVPSYKDYRTDYNNNW